MEFQILRAGGARPRHLRALVTSLLESPEDDGAHHSNVKPFTVEPPVPTESGFALLVTTLDDATAATLEREARRVQLTGQRLRLGDLEARLAPDPVVEVARRSYRQLREDAPSSPTVRVELRTPTVFRSGKHDQVPFPLPSQVFGHYRSRWNDFAPKELACDLAFDRLGLRVAGFEGHGEPFVDGHRRGNQIVDVSFLGFVGLVVFEAVGPTARPPALRWLHTLASLADFCGTGANTTIGMGASSYLGS